MTGGGAVSVHVTLTWDGRGHWQPQSQRPCRVCVQPTNMRDTAGQAAHRTCVEGEIEAKVAEFARTLVEAEQARAGVAA